MRGNRSVVRPRRALSLALAWLTVTSGLTAESMSQDEPADLRGATLSLVTYNVAGLPGPLSASDPAENSPAIGALLNHYQLALVQEDFAYHDALATNARHESVSTPAPFGTAGPLGDGLNRFSAWTFSRFERHRWRDCHGTVSSGSDCLTGKGFSVAEHHVAARAAVDVYNVHMDAGRAPGDRGARAAQVRQLTRAIAERSDGRAVIVAGDTNLDARDGALLDALLEGAKLTDACRAMGCPTPGLIDRVMFRSSARVALEAVRFETDRRFVRPDGKRLSDHPAVGVVLRWELREPPGAARPR